MRTVDQWYAVGVGGEFVADRSIAPGGEFNKNLNYAKLYHTRNGAVSKTKDYINASVVPVTVTRET